MNYIKYQHVERLDAPAVEGLLNGICSIFPKLDGTNGTVYLNDQNEIECGSRNRVCSIENDNQGFAAYILNNNDFKKFFEDFPFLRLYGEWLVPHSLKTYRDSAWRKFYIFDVYYESGIPMSYDNYVTILERYNLDYIPRYAQIFCPSEEALLKCAQENCFLIKDGAGAGEGIVIKNYDAIQYDKYSGPWAKLVLNEFKEQHKKEMPDRVQMESRVENKFIAKYVTTSFVEKEMAKLGEWNSYLVPRLLSTCYSVVINEEIWNAVKFFKQPVIDFKYLQLCVTEKVKQVLRDRRLI